MQRIDLDYTQLLVLIGYSWIDLSSDQRGRITCEWGLMSNNPLDRVSQTGRMTFELINTTRKYTPGTTTALAGWAKGLPVKLVATYWGEDFTRWKGVIDDIDIILGVGGHQYVRVSCVDWIDYAAKTPIVTPGILEDKTADEVLTEVVDLSPIAPDGVDFDTGIINFPTALDTTGVYTKAYSEFVKIALSEMGYIYLIKDQATGETLVFEAANHRTGLDTLTPLPASLLPQDGGFLLLQGGGRRIINTEQSGLTIDNTMLDTTVNYGDQIINRLSVIANPRRLDDSPQILFQLDQPITISSGQTLEISGTYADPAGGGAINAQDMIAPAATTDYLMNRQKNGGGANITADLTIVDGSYGAEGFTHTVRNDSGYTGYIIKYNARGTWIFIYNPIEYTEMDAESVLQYGYQNNRVDQKYQNELDHGKLEIAKVVEFYKTPRTLIDEVEFCANVSDEMMLAFLHGDVGDLFRIVEDQLDIDGWYHIHGVRFTLERGVIMCSWIVKAFYTLALGLTLLSVEFGGAGTKDAIDFGHLPDVFSNDSPTTISISAWIYPDNIDTGMITTFPTNNGGFRFYHASRELNIYSNIFDAWPGQWWTTTDPIVAGSWYHVVVTYDYSDVANDPVFYVDGALMGGIAEVETPAGNPYDRAGVPLMIGNQKSATEDYDAPFDGEIADVRIYHHTLNLAEVGAIYAAGRGGTYNPADLVVWGPCVRTSELPEYVDQDLEDNMKLLDIINGVVGTPLGDPPPIGRDM